ncbi:N-terminus of Esterase_SGNH_hydro-type [Daejeonella rubra]|uniref:N-terminus of Esterase_SGNH_hydro-type n=1 Tax=Daejeonella rubra TaxID=990371 RepID=A0A1G9VDD0_9SPHI|nr:SGNH/GDSL hydrolase family protein [Daejeonella rubra]SDM70073.1 N-terminus of Esterase_SGNH_hydro-type [Daejeonella rubra]
MNRFICLLLLTCLSSSVFSQETSTKKENVTYYGKEHFLIEGTGVAETEKESPYDRLPASYKDKVRKPVWGLSKNSAGISLRFNSNSTSIKVKWSLLNDTKMNHMAETGIKGVDLYCKLNGVWTYVNTGRPTAKENEAALISSLSPVEREYKLYLPLYDGTTKVEIGIDNSSVITKPAADKQLPIVFYGTSILQGGCASRPGMVFTSIISRKLNVDCINFGFSGNGMMDPPIAELISGIKASFYVIDCLPNMTAKQVTDSVIPLATAIRKKNPNTPIVFVENVEYTRAIFQANLKKSMDEKNQALKTEFDKLVRGGMKDLIYISATGSIGTDNEGTVDGTHLTDLGFIRYADYLIEKFKENKLAIK